MHPLSLICKQLNDKSTNNMKKHFLFFASLFLALQLFSQPAASPAFVRDSLDTYVERALVQWQIPGVAVGIVKDGELIVAKGYGVRELGKQDKVDANTLFMIGSNTKAFTGTALALLEHESRCNLTDPVKKYLPKFDMKDNWVESQINLLDIVSHRIGMETFQGDFMYWTSDLTQDQVVEKFGKLQPAFSFRSKWGYCNAGYVVAGKVIESISLKSWGDYLRERMFVPLGMERTLAMSAEIAGAENAARAHTVAEGVLKGIPYGNIDNLAPAGSISSSINDMSRWARALLANGQLDGKEVIPPAVIARTQEPLSIMGRRRTTNTGIKRHYALYGMGWDLSDYAGREMVSHTGGVNGFFTSFTLVPEENLAVIVLTNTDANMFFIALQREIVDAFLGLPYQDYSRLFYENYMAGQEEEKRIVAQLRDTIATNPATALPLDRYTGRYDNDVYGWLDMKKEGNNLKLTFQHHSNLTGLLEPLGGNRFLLSFNDPVFGIKPVRFNLEEGRVKNFILNVADFIEITTYEFVKR